MVNEDRRKPKKIKIFAKINNRLVTIWQFTHDLAVMSDDTEFALIYTETEPIISQRFIKEHYYYKIK